MTLVMMPAFVFLAEGISKRNSVIFLLAVLFIGLCLRAGRRD